MPGSTISLGIEVDGEKSFRSAIAAIDAEIKSFSAGIGAADEQMKAMGGDAEASARKNELYGKTIAANQEKLKLLSQQYDNARGRLDELGRALEAAKASNDPAAIDKAANAYNRQSAQVSNLASKISNTEKAIASANNSMNQGADALEFVGKAASAVVDGFTKIVNGAIDAGKAIFNLTTEAGKYADNMLTLAETSNVDVINLQKWEYASQFIDTEVSTITGSLTKLTKNMTSESAATTEAFSKLGVSVKDSSGNFRDAEAVMWDAIDALGNVANQTERDSLAMTLFGKSAQELNPLINAGSEAFKALGDEAEAAGLILSEDAMGALGGVDDAMNRVNSSITGVKNAVAVAFAPAVTELADGANEVVQAMIGMVNGTEGSSEKFISAIDHLTDTAMRLLDDMLPVVLETGVNIIVNLVNGILNNIDKVTTTIKKVISELLQTIARNLPDILKAGVEILISIIDGIISAIPTLVDNLPQIISAIVSGLAALSGRLVEAGWNIIKGIGEGLKQGIAWLGTKIKDFFGGLLGKVLNFFGIHSPSTVMRDLVGKNLVLGVAQGITRNAAAITDAWDKALPSAAQITASIDTATVAARVADQQGTSVPWQDNRPIIIQLNDRELGRAVRGYA